MDSLPLAQKANIITLASSIVLLSGVFGHPLLQNQVELYIALAVMVGGPLLSFFGVHSAGLTTLFGSRKA